MIQGKRRCLFHLLIFLLGVLLIGLNQRQLIVYYDTTNNNANSDSNPQLDLQYLYDSTNNRTTTIRTGNFRQEWQPPPHHHINNLQDNQRTGLTTTTTTMTEAAVAPLQPKENHGTTLSHNNDRYNKSPYYKWYQPLTESHLSTGLLRYEENFFSTTKRKGNRTNTTTIMMNTTTPIIYDKLSIIPLLTWEYETIGNPTVEEDRETGGTLWNPPPHSHETCAIGSISTGGGIRVAPGCAKPNVYKEVYDHIIQIEQFQDEGRICDVCHMLDILATTGQRLVFWGDSLQRQSFDGLLCEIQRRQYRVIYREEMTARTGLFAVTDLTTVLIELPTPMTPMTPMTTTAPLVPPTSTSSTGNDDRNKGKNATTLPLQHQQRGQQQRKHRYVTLQYLAQYRPAQSAQQVYEESLAPYLFNETIYTHDERLHHVTQQPIIYLLSFGLHFPIHKIETYTRRIKATIEAIQFPQSQPQQHYKDDDNDQGKSKGSSSGGGVLPGPMSSSTNRILWRETSSQHFNSSLGYHGERNRKTYHCLPIQTSNYTYHPDWGWHERIVVDKIAMDDGWKIVSPSAPSSIIMGNDEDNNGNNNDNNNHPKMQKLLIKIPFRDFSALFHRLHSNGECTHFCSTPHFWNYQWRHIRMAMETYFS